MSKESVLKMWNDYFTSIEVDNPPLLEADHFCDNEKDANACADLVNKGIKQATASSLWTIEKTNSILPKEGDTWLVTNWSGDAVCIVKTTKVSIIPFNQISEENAYREGEGDKSLCYWRQVHKEFYQRELQKFDLEFDETMPVVFEEFEKVFP